MATFEFRMEGIEELENDLRETIEDCPKELKKGLNGIANDFRKSARKRTPDYKNHKGNPKLKLKRRYNKYAFVQDDKTGVLIYNDAPHFHLVERGHQLVRGGKLGEGGKVVGFVPGKHMMEKTKNEYEEIVPEKLEKILDDILKERDLD
ncbi:MAG: hypothetical protein HFG50_15815 [Lachnospiraceae bacterium]|jgi:hypothetical protein|nr:hypothetical protein [Lachnospiraceae bacterium]MCI9181436.1 hypothetical protein [Lachnospiraceae bacterium]